MLECTMAPRRSTTRSPRRASTSCRCSSSTPPTTWKGTRWDEEKEKFADRCFDILEEYAPNFKSRGHRTARS